MTIRIIKSLINAKIHAISTGVITLFLIMSANADLTALTDSALSDQVLTDEALGEITGQALFKIEEADSTTQADISFTKLTLGLEIAMNVNIEELAVGRYYRQGGNTCMAGQKGRFWGV